MVAGTCWLPPVGGSNFKIFYFKETRETDDSWSQYEKVSEYLVIQIPLRHTNIGTVEETMILLRGNTAQYTSHTHNVLPVPLFRK